LPYELLIFIVVVNKKIERIMEVGGGGETVMWGGNPNADE